MNSVFRNFFSLFLALVMCLSIVPLAAFAEEETELTEEVQEEVQTDEVQAPAEEQVENITLPAEPAEAPAEPEAVAEEPVLQEEQATEPAELPEEAEAAEELPAPAEEPAPAAEEISVAETPEESENLPEEAPAETAETEAEAAPEETETETEEAAENAEEGKPDIEDDCPKQPFTAKRSIVASGECGENLTWELDENGVLVISGTGAMDDFTSSSAAPWYEYRSEIESVDIQSGITVIGEYAFSGCSGLTRIVVPSGVTIIGDSAFSGCSGLTSITIPSSVTSIGAYVFSGCSSLKTAGPIGSGSDLEFGWTESIPPCAFSGSSLTSIEIPAGVTIIGEGALAECSSLTSIEIPAGVTVIERSAFYGCSSLTNIVIPSGVMVIENGTFINCSSLTNIEIPSSVTIIEDWAFATCESLTNITLPAGVTSLGEFSFVSCRNLESITIPSSVTSIGSCAFDDCNLTDVYFSGTEMQWDAVSIEGGNEGLTNAAIHFAEITSGTCVENLTWELDENGVLSISGAGAMPAWDGPSAPWADYAENIVSVVIEDGVTSIGSSAFYGCELIESISIPGSVAAIGSYAFSGCSSLQSVIIPSGVTIIEEATFGGCSSLQSVTIPGSVTEICDSAFYYCSALTEVAIPNSVTEIGNAAFRSCSSLKEIIIPSSVTYIAPYAFNGCSEMTYAEINAQISIVEFSAFNSCRSLSKVVLPSGLVKISDYAFDGCRSLKEINLPDSLLYVGIYAFRACSALEEINIPEKTTEIRDYAFAKCSSLQEIILPDSVKYIGTDAFDGCKALKTAVLPQNKLLTKIYDRVFSSCSALTEITIPSTVTAIGIAAFMGCSSLTSVTVPERVTTINDAAFNGCTGLTRIVFEGNAPEIGSYVFYKVTADAKYPCTNTSWTSSKQQQYEGTLTWGKAHAVISHEAKAASCEEVGWEAYETCANCIDYTTYVEIPTLGHDYVHHEAKAPNCTEVGWEAYDTCSRCDYSTYIELPEAHDLVHHDAQTATCGECGWEPYDTCRRCDYSTYEEIPALGHELLHHDAQAATCTKTGWAAYDTCSRCDYSTYEEIPAFGHDLEHHGAQNPTATEAGWEAYDSCTRCDYSTKKTTYLIIYELNGGTNSTDNPDRYTVNELLKFSDPTRVGYDFAGWYKDAAFKTKILQINKGTTGTVTVYAKWAALPKYKITYKNLPTYGKGSMDVPDNSMNPAAFTIDNKPEELFAPKVPGYTFEGWYADSKLTKPVTEDFWTASAKTVYAKVTPVIYNISFDLAGGTAPAKGNKTEYTIKTAVPLNSPTRAGYTFAGWYLGDTKLTKLAANTYYGGDIELVAHWTANSYTLVLNGNGGTVSGQKQVKISGKTGETIELSSAVRVGYTFAGWAAKNNGTGDEYPAGAASLTPAKNKATITLYAKWIYKVKFEASGGVGVMDEQEMVFNQSAPLEKGTFTKTGYYIAGWNTDRTKAGKGTIQYKDGASVKNLAGKTLYAVWKPITYKVIFHINNGGTDKTKTQTLTYGKQTALAANSFSWKGHKFIGWAKTPGGEKDYNNKQKVSSLMSEQGAELHLYALWS